MRASGSPVYYGWFVLAASAVCELLVMGATAYAAGLFVLPLQAEFHISRAAANSSVIILYLGASIAAPFIGRLLDRLPIRLVVSAGAIILALAFAGIAATSSLLVMALLLLIPASIAFVALGPLTTQTLTTRWFNRHRGLALGIAAVATSGGGFVVVPLLGLAIQHYGWRQGLFYEGMVVAIIIIVLALTVLRSRPSDVGLENHPESLGAAREAGPVTVSLSEMFLAGAFWIPSLALAVISGTSQATVITLVPYGVQLGFTPAQATLLISGFSIAAAVTKIGAGLLADRINQRLLLVIAALAMMLSWLALLFSPSYGALLAGACLAGVALGCALPTTAGLIATHFGAQRFGAVMGWTSTLTGILAIVAVLFVGAVFDRSHSYVLAFQVFVGLLACLLAATLVFLRRGRAARA
jgi:sugar phosphate permease